MRDVELTGKALPKRLTRTADLGLERDGVGGRIMR